MIERLAVPCWDTAPTSLESWVNAFQSKGIPSETIREDATITWLEVPLLRIRGYVVMQGTAVEAINFELAGPEPASALARLDEVAASLHWELHEDDEEDEEDEQD